MILNCVLRGCRMTPTAARLIRVRSRRGSIFMPPFPPSAVVLAPGAQATIPTGITPHSRPGPAASASPPVTASVLNTPGTIDADAARSPSSSSTTAKRHSRLRAACGSRSWWWRRSCA